MNWHLIVRARATVDLQKAHDWYESQQKGLGIKFVSATGEAFLLLEMNPYICQIYFKKFRQMLTAGFPYRIIYFVDGRHVVVARVFHSAQDFSQHI